MPKAKYGLDSLISSDHQSDGGHSASRLRHSNAFSNSGVIRRTIKDGKDLIAMAYGIHQENMAI